jgi:hypothetical protein
VQEKSGTERPRLLVMLSRTKTCLAVPFMHGETDVASVETARASFGMIGITAHSFPPRGKQTNKELLCE